MAVFKGVPFASPPIGSLRWREPQPVMSWSGMRDATKSSHPCMQNVNGRLLSPQPLPAGAFEKESAAARFQRQAHFRQGLCFGHLNCSRARMFPLWCGPHLRLAPIHLNGPQALTNDADLLDELCKDGESEWARGSTLEWLEHRARIVHSVRSKWRCGSAAAFFSDLLSSFARSLEATTIQLLTDANWVSNQDPSISDS
jgi:hypothetical protein